MARTVYDSRPTRPEPQPYKPHMRYVLKMSFGKEERTEFFYEGITDATIARAVAVFADDIKVNPADVGYSLKQEETPMWFNDILRTDWSI